MSFAVVAGVGGAIVGGAIAADGAKGAAKTQAKAAQDANQVNLDIFNQQTALQEPFRQNGLAATNRLAFLLGLQNGSGEGAPSGAGMQGGADLGGSFTSQTSPLGLTMGTPLVPQSQFNEGAYLQANPDVAAAVAKGQTTAYQHYLKFGQHEQRSLGNTTKQVFVPAAAPAPTAATAGAAPASSPANDQTGFGSLNQQFSQADFAADGAPKFDPFTNPNALPTFNQQAPDVANFAQRGAAPQIGQYAGSQNLDGFEDMPAFDASMMKDDPGYQFRRDEGLKGLDHTAAAHGGALSGAAIKAAERFGQDYASNEFGNSFNRYQTTRGNKLQSFLTNRDTSQLNNTNQLTDYTTNRATQQQNVDNSVRDFNDNLGVQQQNYANQRSAFDTNFNQFQVGRTNAVNDNKDALNVYSLNRANGLQDYQAAYDRFQTDRSNVMNPLLSIMGAGQQATNQQSAAAQNFGNQSAAAIQAAGNARAAGQVGSASAINGSIGKGTNQLMNLLMQPGATSGLQASFSNTGIGSSGFGTGLAYGNQDFGQFF